MLAANKLNILFFLSAARRFVNFGETIQAAKCPDHHPFPEVPVTDPHFRRQLEGYGLTTASILYRLPDHPALLQEFIWQDYDLFPDFPVLTRFIDFWKREIEGALHSVRVAHNRLITPAEMKAIGAEFRLH
jgi:uncharacterized protein Usg